jgi:type I pantothenate kinase
MSQSEELSAYITFGRSEWAALRFNTPLTLSEADLSALRGLNEPITPAEVADAAAEPPFHRGAQPYAR